MTGNPLLHNALPVFHCLIYSISLCLSLCSTRRADFYECRAVGAASEAFQNIIRNLNMTLLLLSEASLHKTLELWFVPASLHVMSCCVCLSARACAHALVCVYLHTYAEIATYARAWLLKDCPWVFNYPHINVFTLVSFIKLRGCFIYLFVA